MPTIYAGIAAVAAATLLYEIALTRLFSIAHGYHFAFLAISIALLGFGASGSLLALRPRWSQRLSPGRLGWLAAGFALALLSGYLVANYVPFDPYRVAWEPIQFVLLAVYLLSFAAPFLLVGLVLGLPLTGWPHRSGSLYGANLAGSGIGCLLALALLDRADPSAAVMAASLVAAGGSAAFAVGSPETVGSKAGGRGAFVAAGIAVLLPGLLLWQRPGWFEINLSPYKSLSQLMNYPDARVVHHGSNSLSRVDVVESSAIRSAPGLSLAYNGPLPEQTGLVIDAESVLTLTSRKRLTPRFLDAMPTALPYLLRPRARALILEPGGGLDVLSALSEGARSVVAVERNPLLAELIRSRFAARAGGVYSNPRVELVVSSPRSYLARTDERFDVIALSLSENRRPITAGAFSLSESYLMTAEAFDAYLSHLAPGGVLVVHRWLQLPPTEELRAAGLALGALEQAGVGEASRSMLAVRSFSTMLIVAKSEAFSRREIAITTSFARARKFDLVHYPGISPSEANRFNVLKRDRYYQSFRALLADPQGFYDGYEYDVRPPSDLRPFFFHFFKWAQTPTVLALLGKTWQPFGGSGYLIVLALLVVVTLLSLVLIVLPIAAVARRRGHTGSGGWLRPTIYFASLGFGFLLVEVGLIQRFILFLDHSAQAFSIVLFGLLVFSGIGSTLSRRVPWRAALAALVVAVALYPVLLSRSFTAFIDGGLPLRILITLLLVAPLGVLMGMPFPSGLRILGETRPRWLPVAWGVNGFASVIGAVLAAVIGLSWGLGVVLASGALAYLVALAAVWARS